MDTFCGFCNTKMWINEQLAKLSNSNPQFFMCYKNGKVMLAESSYNTTRAGSSFNKQREKCRQISRSDLHVQFDVGVYFAWCQS
jgi:hypothetical protein